MNVAPAGSPVTSRDLSDQNTPCDTAGRMCSLYAAVKLMESCATSEMFTRDVLIKKISLPLSKALIASLSPSAEPTQ